MSDYTDWDINDYLPGQPLTSAKAISYHENLDATAEAAPGSPIIVAGWHPWNGTSIGSHTGRIYNSSTDGAVTTIETPVLAAGYEYLLEWINLGRNTSGTASATVDLRLGQTGAYTITDVVAITLRGVSENSFSGGHVILEPQVLAKRVHMVKAFSQNGNSNVGIGGISEYNKSFARADATRIDRIQIVSGVANGIETGQVFLFRRRFEGY